MKSAEIKSITPHATPLWSLLLASICSLAGAATGQQTLVQYDPVGLHDSCIPPFDATTVATVVTASDVTQVGFGCWNNTDVWPVGQIGGSAVLDPNQYVTFTVTPTPNTMIQYDALSYSKRSYVGQGPRQAAVRTSLDAFASDVDSVSGLDPAGLDQIFFDVSGLPSSTGPVEFRVYFYDSPGTGADWADLESSNLSGSGLVLTGSDVLPSIGTSYCITVPNSSGSLAQISASGSTSVAAGTLVLEATGLPGSVSGIFYYGTGQLNLPFGDGFRCVSGMTQRLPFNSAGPGGVMTQPDVFTTIGPNPNVPIVPGTLNFQAWFRDAPAMMSGFNLSDGVAITFVP